MSAAGAASRTAAPSSAAVPTRTIVTRGWTDADDLLERARRKRRRKGVDLLVVNEVGWSRGFEAADNRVLIIDADDAVAAEAAGTKRQVADAVWDAVRVSRGA